MRCLKPRTVGFKSDGKTIAWSQKNFDRQFATFALPCGKCIKCRLEYARQWAVRCVHEAKMHEKNSFITLTYSDEHLTSDKLQYRDWQLFAKKLRKTQNEPISYFVTGEYGDQRKRPHWHAILFNWRPSDLEFAYENHRGDRVYHSKLLAHLWGQGRTDLGSVTFESAGYVARYAAKKLGHGPDGHLYQPISRKSSKHAIGKKFLESYWEDIFNHGRCYLDGGISTPIPRYYEKWLAKEKPQEYNRYVTRLKAERMEQARLRQEAEMFEYWESMDQRPWNKQPLINRQEIETIIIEKNFKILQQHLKGDI